MMNIMDDKKLLKLKQTSVWLKNYVFFTHQEKGTLPSSILWHAIFRYLNYHDIRLMKKHVINDLPTIPKNIEPFEACILEKHHKKPFSVYKWTVCRKLELIHSNLFGPFHVPSLARNKYIITFIDDYSRCVGCTC